MVRFTSKGSLPILVIGFIFIVVLTQAPVKATAQGPPEIDWVEGPTIVNLGDVAQIGLSEDYIFADGEDAREILEFIAEPISKLEVGVIFPKAENEDWGVWFEYDPIGYVRDDEKESLDPKAILENINQGTEEANEMRVKRGFPPVSVICWYEEPHYDVHTNNLIWCVLGECEGTQIVNYNTRPNFYSLSEKQGILNGD